MTLGQRIQELQKQNNLSQEALGEKLGVSRQAISRWEMDGAVPEIDKLIAMGKLFGVSLNDLLQVETGDAGPEPKIVLALPRLWRVGVVVLALLTCLSLGTTTYLGWRLAGVEERLTGAEQRLAALEAQPAGLDASVHMVEDFGWDIAAPYQLDVYLSPFQLLDNKEVSFQCVRASDNFTKTFSAVRSDTGLFTATLYVQDMTPDYTISAVISDGRQEFIQSLVRISNVSSDSFSYQILWTDPLP